MTLWSTDPFLLPSHQCQGSERTSNHRLQPNIIIHCLYRPFILDSIRKGTSNNLYRYTS